MQKLNIYKNSIKSIFSELYNARPSYVIYSIISLSLIPPVLLFMLLDQRVLNGENVWLKPLRFFFSNPINLLCITWYLREITDIGRSKLVNEILLWSVFSMPFFLVSYIAYQASLAQMSHGNFSDSIHAFLSMVMLAWGITGGSSQLLLTFSTAKYFKNDIKSSIYSYSIMIAFFISGLLMTISGAILAVKPHKSALTSISLTGWNFSGWGQVGSNYFNGDFRFAHFLGVHAIWLFPILGHLLRKLPYKLAKIILLAFTFFYLSLFIFISIIEIR